MRIEENGRNAEGERILTILDGEAVAGYALEAAPGDLTVFDDCHRPLDYVQTRDEAIRVLVATTAKLEG